MSIKKTILNLPIAVDETADGDKVVTLIFNGIPFVGAALCHEDDMDFYSDKVGTTIAHFRAMRNCMRYQRDEARRDWKTLQKAYADVMQNSQEEDSYFITAIFQAENRYRRYQKYVREITEALHNYLTGQEKAISSIKRQRAQAENN